MKSELKALLSTIIIMNVSLSFLVFLRIVLRTTRTSHDQKELMKDYSETLFRICL